MRRLVGDVRLVVRGASLPATGVFDTHMAEAVAMSERTRAVLVAIVGDGADCPRDA